MPDILIRMEMPIKCACCQMSRHTKAGFYCYIASAIRGFSCGVPRGAIDRPDWCPLHELPPHGDLIDRDAVLRQIRPYSPDDDTNAVTIWTTKKLVKTAVYKVPVIVPASEEAANDPKT